MKGAASTRYDTRIISWNEDKAWRNMLADDDRW